MDVERIFNIVLYSILLLLMLTMLAVAVWGMTTGELPVNIKWVGAIGVCIWFGGVSLHRLYWYIFTWPRLDDFGRQISEPGQ